MQVVEELFQRSPDDLRAFVDARPGLTPLALAWALKGACYDAWSSAPAAARAPAEWLARLHDIFALPEVGALSAWALGVAALAEGDPQAAVRHLHAAGDRFRRGGDPRHAAETQVPLLVALALLGRNDEALSVAESARKAFAILGDLRSAAKIEMNLGTMLSRGDRYAEAAARYRSAARGLARSGDVQNSIAADIGLADALAWSFELEEAGHIARRARRRAEERGLAMLEAQALHTVGRVEMLCGRPHAALPAMARAVEQLATIGAAPARRLEAEAALADAYAAVGLHEEAVALYTQVAAVALAAGAGVEAARAHAEAARSLIRLRRHGVAQRELLVARAGFEQLGNAASVALVDLYLGESLLMRGDAPAAHERAEHALAGLLASGAPAWAMQARLLAAEAAMASGFGSAARDELLALLPQCADQPHLEIRAQVALARVHLARGDAGAAHGRLERVLDLIDEQRAALPGDDLRASIAESAEVAADLLVRAAQGLLPAAPQRVLAAMDRGQARALELALGASTRSSRDVGAVGTPDGVAPGSTVIPAELHLLRQRQAAWLAAGDTARASAAQGRIRQLEQALLEAGRRRRLARDGPPLADRAGTAPRIAGPAQRPLPCALAGALPSGTAWVQYHWVHQDAPAGTGGHGLVACVVTAADTRVVELDDTGVAESIRALRFQLETFQFGAPRSAAHAAQLAQRTRTHLAALHRQLWQPLAALLSGCRRVVVVPHRALHHVPFCALHDGQTHLVEQHDITTAPSALAWRRLGDRADEQGSRRARLLALAHDNGTLPRVRHELAALAAAFGDRAELLADGFATRAALAQRLPGADIVHIACHGDFRADNPAFSALALADGPLTLHELAGLRLDAWLVVLSACETAASRIDPGGELQGFVRGLLLAGVRCVVAAQWRVQDNATSTLMSDFYAALAAGADPAASLAAAQRGPAGAGVHPYFWAGFVVSGRG